MLYNENLREEEQHLIQQIAEQTERGKIDWELTEYLINQGQLGLLEFLFDIFFDGIGVLADKSNI